MIKMEANLDRVEEEYPPCPTYKKQKTLEEWMDKDMKELYMVLLE